MNKLPILEAPEPSNFLIFVKESITPNVVEIITNQKKLEVKLSELRLG